MNVTDKIGGTRLSGAPVLPLGDRVLVELKALEKQVGGIYLPEGSEKSSREGKVVAAGPGANAALVGRRVLLPMFGGVPVSAGGRSYFVLQEKDVIGAFPEED